MSRLKCLIVEVHHRPLWQVLLICGGAGRPTCELWPVLATSRLCSSRVLWRWLTDGLAVCAALTVLAGCGVDPPTGLEPQTVGPEGGVLRFADGNVLLAFPRGAVSENVGVTVQPATTYPANVRLVDGTVYALGPAGIEFSEPVRLKIFYDTANLPSGVEERELRLYQSVRDGWQKVKLSEGNTSDRLVSGSINGFSVFGILGVLPTEALWAEIVTPDKRIFSGDTYPFEIVVEYPPGPGSPTQIACSVSDASVLSLSGVEDSFCVVTGLGVGTSFVVARINDEFVDSARVTVFEVREPDVVGVVQGIRSQGFLVQDPAWHDSVWVTVEPYTSIFARNLDGSLSWGRESDLAVGDSVRAWYTGGVMTSLPPQVIGVRVEVIEQEQG